MFEETSKPIVLESVENIENWDRNRFFNSTASDDLAQTFELNGSAFRNRFREFFRNFRQGNVYTYRDSLLRHWNRNEYFVEIDLSHLNEYDEVLFNNLQTRPDDIMPYFEAAAKDALKLFQTKESEILISNENLPDFQIILNSSQIPQSLRDINAEHVNKLIKVPGIVISCSKTRSKATVVVIKCTKCHTIKRIQNKTNSMSGVNLPNRCDGDGSQPEPCGPGTFIIMGDSCEYIDQQSLKLQESPEVVPTGEMPRSIHLTVDRYLADKVTAGTRVSVVGISSVMNNMKTQKIQSNGRNKNSLREMYMKVLGIQVDVDGGGRSNHVFTPSEEEEMQRLARDPNIYERIALSIAPQISGEYTINIKKAIACLLMGGSRKILPDGVKLRGDINILLMGDPSTAKSQFLKFVERMAPIGVYTSGKGSSAAGLTASVIKDAKGEFYLEGGAMVLADGGVICIDEFDKMREVDRVAIHEAMEQQTISIAKAGITTVLNCRASVLAAANPIFGRYDDLKGVGENIDLMTTILSRFDCIFIVRDIRDSERDRSIARHVLGVHINSSMSEAMSLPAGAIPATTLKKFIMYCRQRCAPRLNEEASTLLSSQYVHIRNKVRESLRNKPGEAQVVPITVRQLEALVRIAESLAKMRLSSEATVMDVEEALQLFKVSTLAASQSNPMLMSVMSSQTSAEIGRTEEFLRRRIGLRMTTSSKKIIEEALAQGYSNETVKRSIAIMIQRNELQELNQGKIIKRIR